MQKMLYLNLDFFRLVLTLRMKKWNISKKHH